MTRYFDTLENNGLLQFHPLIVQSIYQRIDNSYQAKDEKNW